MAFPLQFLLVTVLTRKGGCMRMDGILLESYFRKSWTTLISWLSTAGVVFGLWFLLQRIIGGEAERMPLALLWAPLLIPLVVLIVMLVWCGVTGRMRTTIMENMYRNWQFRIGGSSLPSSFSDPMGHRRMLRRYVRIDWKGATTITSVRIIGSGGRVHIKDEMEFLQYMDAMTNRGRYWSDFGSVPSGELDAVLVERDSDRIRHMDRFLEALKVLQSLDATLYMGSRVPVIRFRRKPVKTVTWSNLPNIPNKYRLERLGESMSQYFGGEWEISSQGDSITATEKDASESTDE